MELLKSAFEMVTGPDSQWFWGMLQAIFVSITLIFIYHQIRIQRQANSLTALQRLNERWSSNAMKVCRKNACQSVQSNGLEISHNEETVLNFFEEMSLHLEKKVFDIETVWELYSYYVEHYWPLLEPKVNEFRTHTSDRSWYQNSQKLFQKCQKYSKKKGASYSSKSSEQLNKFVDGELQYTCE